MRAFLVFVAGAALAACGQGPSVSPSQCATVCGAAGVCDYVGGSGQNGGDCLCKNKNGDCPLLPDVDDAGLLVPGTTS